MHPTHRLGTLVLLSISAPWAFDGPGQAVAQDGHPVLRLVRETSIGCRLCGGPEELGVVTALSFHDGTLLAADRDAPHLRLFGLDGSLQRVLGPDGDGPGELRFPLAASLGPGGEIVAVDLRRGRVLELGPSGDERGSARLDRFTLAAGFSPDGDRLVLAQGDFRAGRAVVSLWDPVRRTAVPVAGLEGPALPPPGEPPVFVAVAVSSDGRVAVAASEEAYRIRIAVPGAATTELTRDMGPGPHIGPDALHFDPDGRLWVRTDRGEEGATVFDLFDGSVYLGEAVLPARAAAYLPLRDRLIAVELDELDVPTIGIWIIRTPRPGASSR